MAALSMAKFSKLAKIFTKIGNKKVTKFDIDVCYKKMVSFHEQMDYYAFVDSIDYLLDKSFAKTEVSEEDRLNELIKAFGAVKGSLATRVDGRRNLKKGGSSIKIINESYGIYKSGKAGGGRRRCGAKQKAKKG